MVHSSQIGSIYGFLVKTGYVGLRMLFKGCSLCYPTISTGPCILCYPLNTPACNLRGLIGTSLPLYDWAATLEHGKDWFHPRGPLQPVILGVGEHIGLHARDHLVLYSPTLWVTSGYCLPRGERADFLTKLQSPPPYT